MNNFRIVVVDDDHLCLLIAKKHLQNYLPADFNYTLELYDSPETGLGKIKEHFDSMKENFLGEPRIIVLLDISMPTLDGWMVLEQLSILDPDNRIKVLMHSSSGAENDINRAIKNERVIDYIIKPLDKEKVLILHKKMIESKGME